MKLGKFLSVCGISALTVNYFLISSPKSVLAQKATYALEVFVNGSGDCCASAMSDLIQRVRKSGTNTVWFTSYASFRNGSTTRKVPVVNLSTDMDRQFISEAAEVINRQPSDRPIVLIGHSYGGDSILKVLPAIKRRIQLVVVIDPVGTGGARKIATSRVVPSNVDYFMNRWQENGLSGDNIVPFDSRLSGRILLCQARVCDQEAQNLARNADSSEIRDNCRWDEVTCPGFVAPNPFIGRPGRKGTKARRIEHNTMPTDAFIQRYVGDRIREALTPYLREGNPGYNP